MRSAPLAALTTSNEVMLRKLYLVFGAGVLLCYGAASWFGWELANSGSNSRLGVPFIYSGFRGGK